jgi:hypothetical protein
MAWIVVNVSLRNVTIRAFRHRFAAEAGTLGTRQARGARRHARHSLDRTAHELAHLLAGGENGKSTLGREQLTQNARIDVVF